VTLYYQDQDWQDRLKGVLSQEVLPWVKWKQGLLSNSLIQTVRKKILLADFEVLGVPKKLKRTLDFSSIQKWRSIQNTNELLEEDLVIHRIHGLGRYRGLKRIHTQGAGEMDVLELEFADGDRLYLPVYRMDVIQKYGTIENQEIKLDKLGGQGFQLRTQKVREAVKLLAVDLLKIHATRKMTNIQPFTSHPEEMERFTDLFPFTETPDQLKALKEIDEDLESGKLMDRLLCGDVGFGKTEVALRAAYRAILEGYQVALLCPTTLLTLQHENTCIHRFEPFAIRVKSLSRFKSTREQKEVLKSLEDGSLDLVIGTHRLLSRDVRFKKLGLLIVDEEQKLGVEHKEKIKELAQNCHVLTLTATPIPRTLHLGLRDLTILQTPPMRKSSIRTEVHREDWDLIIDAVRFELARDGQVFIVYPHIQELRKIQDKLKEPFPSVPTAMAHGQMGELELEQIILDFYQGKLKVLISTSIIESGLDIPAANTIIVLRSELFGLSQLYQIRGRVGRGERRGYAYLFTGSDGILTTEAQQRLDTLKRYTELGSGFQIASQDLDIRGAGDLLGTKQSGHIHAVGIDLYLELLEEAIRDLKRQTPKDTVTSRTRSPEIQLDLPCYLEDTYIPDLPQRLSIYRRISSLRDREMLHHLKHELLERFGPLPVEGENLFRLVEVKILLMEKGVEKLTVGSERISLHFGPNSPIDLPKAFALVASQPESFRLTPDGKFTLPYHGRTFPELEIALKKVWERILGA
jgi:transcription-repair coupling factor (superfamily II helicase)